MVSMKRGSILFAVCGLLAGGVITAQGQEWRVPIYGCAKGGNASMATVPYEGVSVNMGWKPLDALIVRDIAELQRQFGVTVPVYFLRDNLQDAFFTPKVFPDLIRDDHDDPEIERTGTVFVSMGLLNDVFLGANGSTVSVPAILAHEFAHAMQFDNNFPYHGKWREFLISPCW